MATLEVLRWGWVASNTARGKSFVNFVHIYRGPHPMSASVPYSSTCSIRDAYPKNVSFDLCDRRRQAVDVLLRKDKGSVSYSSPRPESDLSCARLGLFFELRPTFLVFPETYGNRTHETQACFLATCHASGTLFLNILSLNAPGRICSPRFKKQLSRSSLV